MSQSGSADTGPAFSVIVPAHDEQAVIERCLRGLAGPAAAEAQIVVVANGCADDTAGVARRFADASGGDVTVLELAEASKSAALNAGDGAARHFPRIYLDADIVISAGDLRSLRDTLLTAEGPAVASPAIRFRTGSSSPPVRAYYRTYAQTPYVREGLIGLGVYGLNRAGRALFTDFPPITADDLFVQRLFRPGQRLTSPGHFDVQVPRDLRSLVRVRRRTTAGNRELAALPDLPEAPSLDGETTTGATLSALLPLARGGPRQAMDVAAYAGIVLAGRVLSRRRTTWARDDSTRGDSTRGDSTRGDSTRAGATVDDEAFGSTGAPSGRRVAYLVSQYPSISHAFIEREILALREIGWLVDSYSVRRCPPEELISATMRAENAHTRALQEGSRPLLAARAGKVLLTHPRAFATALAVALRSGPNSPRAKAFQLFYLAEAALLYRAMLPRAARHLHVHFANNGADIARLATAFANSVHHRDGDRWTWSIAMHGPTEFADPVAHDLPAKFDATDAVAAITRYCAAQVDALLPEGSHTTVRVVPMSVDTQAYRPRPARPRPAGEAPSEPDAALRVLYVGRLVPEKRPGDLLRAIADEPALSCRVRIIGAGPLRESLQEQIRELGLSHRVDLLGPVSQAELPDQYAWSDVVVLPSEAEGLPVVLMEAMASGRPVVTTPVAGIPELVIDGENGTLIAPGDTSALAKALLRLANDASLREGWGRAARNAVLRGHDSARTVQLLSQALTDVTAGGSTEADPAVRGEG